jgi:hypothetical protein
MNRCQRSSFTASGTGSGSALAAAPLDRRVLEATDAVELRLFEPVEQHAEVILGFPREADDESAADGHLRQLLAPAPDARERVDRVCRPTHQLQDARAPMLERHVEVGQHLALRHERDDLVHMRIRIDVMQAHPGTELAELAREVDEAAIDLAASPRLGPVLEIGTVGARVLRDHEELPHAGVLEANRLVQHLPDRATRKVATHRGNDAEAATVIAALGNLEIGVVPRRETHALWRHEVHERVVLRRQVLVHGADDFLVGMRAR